MIARENSRLERSAELRRLSRFGLTVEARLEQSLERQRDRQGRERLIGRAGVTVDRVGCGFPYRRYQFFDE